MITCFIITKLNILTKKGLYITRNDIKSEFLCIWDFSKKNAASILEMEHSKDRDSRTINCRSLEQTVATEIV